MLNFLVFQLYGVLASWGDIAVGEYRPSQGHPSKSAIMGLLAAALGVDRENDAMHKKLAQHYAVAVRVQSAGELLRDYHTIQVPGGKREYASRRDELLTDKLNLNTILSQRDYRTDGLYQIALWATDDDVPFALKELQQALQKPQFNLYLGRKSCPVSLPLHPVILSCETLKQAFSDYPNDKAETWTDSLACADLVSYFWEPCNLNAQELGMEASMVYSRRDQIISRKRWQFSNRDEYYYAETVEGE